MRRLLEAAAILAVTLLTYFFPGHTYLQSDTQIYVPMLEHLDNPSALAADLSATRPHLTFTIYDEVTRALRHLFGTTWRGALEAQQFLFRAAGVWGLYLLAIALGLERRWALLAAAWLSLGAVIAGPAVLTIEYEPVPRGFALSLTLLALGLEANELTFAAGLALALALLYHTPTAAPMLALFLLWIVRKPRPQGPKPRLPRRFVLGEFPAPWAGLLPLAAGAAILALAAALQAGQTEHQTFFALLDPPLAAIQRFRAPYNWVSAWGPKVLAQYPLLFLLALAAFRRLKPPDAVRWFAGGLLLLGLLSIPTSWLLLERLHWALIPQFQPARAALFVELLALALSACAAARAAAGRRYFESLLWLLPVFAAPQQARLLDLVWPGFTDPLLARRLFVTLACASAAAALLTLRSRPWTFPAAALFTLATFFAIPQFGRVVNYPSLSTPELQALINFARNNTPPSAVFLFPAAGHGLEPGIFRAEAVRTVYVDWKIGGQANYYRDLAFEWWNRWSTLMAPARPSGPSLPAAAPPSPSLRARGIDYIILPAAARLAGPSPVYANAAYALYKVADLPAGASAASGQKLLDFSSTGNRRLGAPACDRNRRRPAGEAQCLRNSLALGQSNRKSGVEYIPGGSGVDGIDPITGLEEFDGTVEEEGALMSEL
jgi:hypothetical protein